MATKCNLTKKLALLYLMALTSCAGTSASQNRPEETGLDTLEPTASLRLPFLPGKQLPLLVIGGDRDTLLYLSYSGDPKVYIYNIAQETIVDSICTNLPQRVCSIALIEGERYIAQLQRPYSDSVFVIIDKNSQSTYFIPTTHFFVYNRNGTSRDSLMEYASSSFESGIVCKNGRFYFPLRKLYAPDAHTQVSDSAVVGSIELYTPHNFMRMPFYYPENYYVHRYMNSSYQPYLELLSDSILVCGFSQSGLITALNLNNSKSWVRSCNTRYWDTLHPPQIRQNGVLNQLERGNYKSGAYYRLLYNPHNHLVYRIVARPFETDQSNLPIYEKHRFSVLVMDVQLNQIREVLLPSNIVYLPIVFVSRYGLCVSIEQSETDFATCHCFQP
jgi:hypothetical protein